MRVTPFLRPECFAIRLLRGLGAEGWSAVLDSLPERWMIVAIEALGVLGGWRAGGLLRHTVRGSLPVGLGGCVVGVWVVGCWDAGAIPGEDGRSDASKNLGCGRGVWPASETAPGGAWRRGLVGWHLRCGRCAPRETICLDRPSPSLEVPPLWRAHFGCALCVAAAVRSAPGPSEGVGPCLAGTERLCGSRSSVGMDLRVLALSPVKGARLDEEQAVLPHQGCWGRRRHKTGDLVLEGFSASLQHVFARTGSAHVTVCL